MLLGSELVVATDLSFASVVRACRGSGVRVSLAPFFETQSKTGFSCFRGQSLSGVIPLVGVISGVIWVGIGCRPVEYLAFQNVWVLRHFRCPKCD